MPDSLSCLYARERPDKSEAINRPKSNRPGSPTRSSSALRMAPTGASVPCKKRRQDARLSPLACLRVDKRHGHASRA